MAQPRAVIRRSADVPASPVDHARAATIQVLLGPTEGVANFVMRRFTLDPGGRIPSHRHDAIEHEQLVLEGEMVVSLDGREETVRTGDCLYIPVGVVHWYENRKKTPARFICIVPRTDEYRTEWLE